MSLLFHYLPCSCSYTRKITIESLKVDKSLFYESWERGVPDSTLSRECCFEKVQSELYLPWKYQEKSLVDLFYFWSAKGESEPFSHLGCVTDSRDVVLSPVW